MNRNTQRITFLLLLLTSVSLPAQTPAAAPSDLDSYVGRVMQEFEVPGVGVALVKDGQVLVARGYGVRRLGEAATVDAETLFAIASNTKAFTAAALGLLVDEGKLDWDAPVVNYLPGFQLWDPHVTREITVRDLLVHRSGLGLGAGDLLWWPPTTYDRPEIVRRLRFIRPATSFRSHYAYDNVLYTVAGEVVQAVSETSWEDFVASRIFRPVGMSTSTVRRLSQETQGNIARPHAQVDGAIRPIAPFVSSNTNPAGGIYSNAQDMAKWLLVQLAEGGLPDGSQLFSKDTARQLTTLITPMPVSDPPAELPALRTDFKGYALGFNVLQYRRLKLVTHTGVSPGYVSRVAMIPDLDLGVAVLTNQESAAAHSAIAWHVLDQYLSAPPVDWIAGYKELQAREQSEEKSREQEQVASRNTSSRPSLPLSNYAGVYADAWYGDVILTLEKEGLVIRFSHSPALVGDLVHWQYDTFVARWRDRELRADAFVTFALNPEGTVDQVKMKAVSPATDFSYDFQDLLLKPVPTRTKAP
ncbi:MAG: serine hydrolase [Solirubrobacterales bacterium]